MKLLIALAGALCATLVASVTIPEPTIRSFSFFGELSAAQSLQFARPPALLERGAEAPGPAFSGAWMRRRETRLNGGLLGSITAGMVPAVTLNLFGDVDLVAIFDRMEDTNPGRVWVGHLEGEPLSTVTLAVVDGVLSGIVSHAGGLYEVTADADGDAVVSRLDPSQIRNDEPIPVPGDPVPDAEAGLSTMGGAPTIVTVLNVYTPAARRRAGSHAAMRASIAGNIARQNTAFINSGVMQRVRQVLVRQMNYRETRSGSLSTDLNRLQSTNDGFLRPVHTVRNNVNADLVSLIVSQAATNACQGLAFVPINGAPTAAGAFSVIEFPLCMATIVYAHEHGHNMGLKHDWYVSSDMGTFPYGHGHVDTVKRFITIMAYLDRCQALGRTCIQSALFSNPAKRFMGRRTGTGNQRTNCIAGRLKPTNCAANAARALNGTRNTVGAFR